MDTTICQTMSRQIKTCQAGKKLSYVNRQAALLGAVSGRPQETYQQSRALRQNRRDLPIICSVTESRAFSPRFNLDRPCVEIDDDQEGPVERCPRPLDLARQ